MNESIFGVMEKAGQEEICKYSIERLEKIFFKV